MIIIKKIVYKGKDDFSFKNYERRKCNKNEIEVKTSVLGLCGSDIHKFLKQTPADNYLKTDVLGHEISGVVSSIGNDIDNIKVGDRVVINPFNITNKTIKYDSFSFGNNIDIVGRTIDGGYAEYIYLPKDCVYKLPNSINDYEAIFIDDIAVALHGIHYINEYNSKSENIAIIGDGPLGLLCYRVLKAQYDKSNIVLFSKNMEKLTKLNINAIPFDKIDKYQEKFNVVLEAVGGNQSDTLNKAINIGTNNCLILCYGVFQFGFKADLEIRTLLYKQGIIKGINSYCNIHDDFNRAIDLLSTKKIEVEDLITARISFDDSIQYIKNYPRTKNNIKTVFEVKQ